ncbi:MAG: ATP-binding protein [Chloroflexota bacterium]
MKKSIDRIFQIPEYGDNESNIVARLTINAAISMALLGIVFVIGAALAAPALVQRATLLTITSTLTCFGVIALIRNQKLQLASGLLVGIMWLAITLGSITAGGVSAPIFIGYLIVILASGLVSKHKFSILTVVACTLTGIIILLAESNGRLPEPTQYTATARLGIYLFFFVVTFLLQNVNTRNMQGLLTQAVKSQAQYKSLLENIPTTTYINNIDENAHTEYVSPQVEKLLGYPREMFLLDPMLWQKILHPDDHERVMNVNLDVTKSGVPFNMEYRLLAKDQRVVWVKDDAILVKDELGVPQYWLGVWTDITARKHAEEEQADLISVMTKRTIQLQTAADVSRAASSILDLNKLLPTVADLICNHFDYYYVGIFLVEEATEWAILSAATGSMGRQMLDTGHRLKVEDSSMIGWCIKHGQARIALDVGEDAVRFKNPYLPLTRSEMALPLITRGEVIGAMTIQSQLPAAFSRVDITALQTMSDQVANAIKNARLFTDRVNLNKELSAQNAELERFTYTVSHDLKSPLVTIRGFLGYLRQDAESGDMLRFEKDMHRVANAVDKMQALLNDLLELSRVGRIINTPEKIPFGQIVAEAVELLNGPLEKNNIRMVVHGDFPDILGDHARLVEVMQNLISNAAKFMGAQLRPTIEVGTDGTDADGKTIFFVRDNGIGIAPQYHERIFGLFNRLDPAVEGTGIGLTLVKRIIEIHNGRIWVKSQVGEGTTFYFTL